MLRTDRGSGSARLVLHTGARVLNNDGVEMVVAIQRHGVRLQDALGVERFVPHSQIEAREVATAGVQGVHTSLRPWWDGLSEVQRTQALVKLQAVWEVRTGYREGHPALAIEGEPFHPFGSIYGASVHQRCRAMAAQLTYERSMDRRLMRRVHEGELASPRVTTQTVYLWVRAYERDGLRGLVDKRSTKTKKGFADLDPAFLRIAEEELARFNGTISGVSRNELERRILVRLKQEGVTDPDLPVRLTKEFLSARRTEHGRTTKQHRSHAQRGVSSKASYAAVHPSHVCIDSTRADDLVHDELHDRVYSVEVTICLSVSTRVVLGMRITPRSANGIEAGLVLYDTMRPQSMLVDGTNIDDWRWAGIPESLDLTANRVHLGPRPTVHTGPTLQGLHHVPGLAPTSLRADHGAIFVGGHFRSLLHDFGIDLMLSRGSKPSDNPAVERLNETLQRAYQAIPGFKGRGIYERGRWVGIRAEEPLLTAHELEQHLRRFIALDYHRTPHDGLHLPGAPQARISPLEMFDFTLEASGRLHVPQQPDLLYQFLPLLWLTCRHDGVEHKNLTYDAAVLDEFRNVRPGTFQPGTRKMPLHIDSRDLSRLWFRHPDTDRIHEIPWRAAHLARAPLGEVILDAAITRIHARGGNRASSRTQIRDQIIDELTELTAAKSHAEHAAQMSATRLRYEQSLRDHVEAALAASRLGEPAHDIPRNQLAVASNELDHSSPQAETPTSGPPNETSWDTVWPDYDENAG